MRYNSLWSRRFHRSRSDDEDSRATESSRCFATLRQLRTIRRYTRTYRRSVIHFLFLQSFLAAWIIATVCWSTCLSLTTSVSSQSKIPQQGSFKSFSTRDVVTTSPTRSSVFIGTACRSELHSTDYWFNVATLTYPALHGSAPPYLAYLT